MKIGAYVLALCLCLTSASAQDLEPRAYTHFPIDLTLLSLGGTYSHGSVVTDPTIPLENLEASVVSLSLGVSRTFSIAGQTAQIMAVLPISWAEASALVFGEDSSTTRFGQADMRFRLSWLPFGAPATDVRSIASAERKTIVGTSLAVIAPTGQAFSDRLINIGTHRWSFKPEIALSQPFGREWTVDLYTGVWFFTDNASFYPGTSLREQDPIIATQAHVSYETEDHLWAAINVTYYVGGNSYINGDKKDDYQNNVRVGGTLVLPISKQHSIKFAASTGAVIRIGANFATFSVAWQSLFF